MKRILWVMVAALALASGCAFEGADPSEEGQSEAALVVGLQNCIRYEYHGAGYVDCGIRGRYVDTGCDWDGQSCRPPVEE